MDTEDCRQKLETEINRLKAERDALREALEKIANADDWVNIKRLKRCAAEALSDGSGRVEE